MRDKLQQTSSQLGLPNSFSFTCKDMKKKNYSQQIIYAFRKQAFLMFFLHLRCNMTVPTFCMDTFSCTKMHMHAHPHTYVCVCKIK